MELYDLTDDIGEQNNLANANPAKRGEFLADLFAWIKSTDALLPNKMNPQYDPLAQSGANKRGANDYAIIQASKGERFDAGRRLSACSISR